MQGYRTFNQSRQYKKKIIPIKKKDYPTKECMLINLGLKLYV